MNGERRKSPGASISGQTRNITLAAILILTALAVNAANPHFLTANNLAVIGLQMSFIGIAAVGTTLLMVGGQLDLSIGSTFALASVVAAVVCKSWPSGLALLAGVAVGALAGLINGAIVWRVRISPLIVTLGALTFLRGVVRIVSGNRSVSGLPKAFSAVGQFDFLGLPAPLVILIGLASLAGIVLSKTTLGLRIQAFGDNRAAAQLAGINPRRLMLGLFAFNGALAGGAGTLAASRLDGASPNFGIGFELDVITAVVLGGVSIMGGEGRIFGVMLALCLLGVIQAGIVALGLDPNIGRLCTGGALILAVALDQIGHEQHERLQTRLAMEEFAGEGGVAERLGLRKVKRKERLE
jgi:ribose/xylose/arabinose/galactoside ABC-type transport system permease subunit